MVNSVRVIQKIQYFQKIMSNQERNKRSSYKKISEQIRQTIIDRILNNGQNIKDVSLAMNINISTCKAIIKVFQEEGRIGKKKKRNKVVNVIETFSFYCINDGTVDEVQPVQIQESKISLNRNEDLDKTLEDNAKAKAEKMLDSIVENKKKQEESAAEMQRQMLQMQSNYAHYFATMNPFMVNHPSLLPPMLPQLHNAYLGSSQGSNKKS